MKNNRKKMSNRSFRLIIIPIVSILLILAITAQVLMGSNASTMDRVLGTGRKVIDPGETKGLNTSYYEYKAQNANEAAQNALAVSQAITDEGVVLLKNDGILPLSKDAVLTPFGYEYSSTIGQEPFGDFQLNTAALDQAAGAQPEGVGTDGIMTSPAIEYNPAIYAGLEDSCKNTIGLVVIRRGGREGADLQSTAFPDGTPHALALTENEKGTIQTARQICGKVIVLISAQNVMELEELEQADGPYAADAIVWLGTPGSVGYTSTAAVLCGDVNPSGRTPDIYPADLTNDPTYQNFGEFAYDNIEVISSDTHLSVPRTFIEYEEGIYVGYRYYETRAVAYNGSVVSLHEPTFTGSMEEQGKQWYDTAVVYPFGYGLSYTTFTQKIATFDADGDTVNVSVEVKNTGDVAGKDVVQLYDSAPYDPEEGIEKPACQMIAFDKTKDLAPGESEKLQFSIDKESLASYAYHHDNGDGTTGCYILSDGEYTITLRKNSHEIWTDEGEKQERTFTVAKDIVYDNTNPRQSEKNAQSILDADGNPETEADSSTTYVAATNAFDQINGHMDDGTVTNLSRADFAGTFPTTPTENDKHASDYIVSLVKDDFDPQTDPELGNVEGSKVYTTDQPDQKQRNGVRLSELRGKDYNDPAWDSMLDQLNYSDSQLHAMLFQGAYRIAPVNSIALPMLNAYDGPEGLFIAGGQSHNVYPAQVVLASTWNTKLAADMGQAVAEECHYADVTGWYAPGLNLHRTPFCGRNGQYYSEDPLLAGRLGAAVVTAVSERGIFTELKHFAFNEMETNRQFVSTWINEQAIRELYLKAFEIPIKEAVYQLHYIDKDESGNLTEKARYERAAMGVMTAQNYIGGKQCGQDYGLITQVLRAEWGFQGIAETDMYNADQAWMRDQMLRAGTDMWMTIGAAKVMDFTSATARTAMRNAVHHIAYVAVNTAAFDGIAPGGSMHYATSPWRVILNTYTVIASILFVAAAFWIITRAMDEKKHPDQYKDSHY